MLRREALPADVLAAGHALLCEQVRVVMQLAPKGSGETGIWRGTFPKHLCRRCPQSGETLTLRMANMLLLTVSVTAVTQDQVYFRTQHAFQRD